MNRAFLAGAAGDRALLAQLRRGEALAVQQFAYQLAGSAATPEQMRAAAIVAQLLPWLPTPTGGAAMPQAALTAFWAGGKDPTLAKRFQAVVGADLDQIERNLMPIVKAIALRGGHVSWEQTYHDLADWERSRQEWAAAFLPAWEALEGRGPGQPAKAPDERREQRSVRCLPHTWARLEQVAEARGIKLGRLLDEIAADLPDPSRP